MSSIFSSILTGSFSVGLYLLCLLAAGACGAIAALALGRESTSSRSFLISLGMPKNFEELGAKEEDIPKLVHALCYGDGRNGSIRGFVTLNEEDCAKIYKMMV